MAIDHAGFSQVAPNSTGNKIDDVRIENGADDLRRQVVAVGGPDEGDLVNIAGVVGGRLKVDSAVASIAAGDNNIGNVDVASLPSIPAGANNIGDVDVLTLPAISLAASANNIGDVDVVSLPALPAGNNNIGDVDVVSFGPSFCTAKKVQGTAFLNVLQARDAGRQQYHQFEVAPLACTNAEVMRALTGWVNGAAVAATATPAVVPAGKTLRIMEITISYFGLAAVTFVAYRLRVNLAGVAVVSSPLAWAGFVGVPAAVAGAANEPAKFTFPEGLEIPAAAGIAISAQGFSATAVAAAGGFCAANIRGYIY